MSNDGKDLELLVQLIEKSIDPDARVEHNVFLPVLTSPTERTRQCDIVIRQGKPPRETITIVEVQDRNSAVDINTFGGWMKKLKDVGAQHLICVSRQDFPDSIKEEAIQSGKTVRLITLKGIPKDSIPIKFNIETSTLTIKAIRNMQMTILDKSLKDVLKLPEKYEVKANTKTKLFSFNAYSPLKIPLPIKKHINDNTLQKFLLGDNLLCLDDLFHFILSKEKEENKIEGTNILDMGSDFDNKLFYYLNGMPIPIRLQVEFDWEMKYNDSPANILSYEQDQYGSLAWIAKNITSFHDTHNIEINFLLIYRENQYYLNKMWMRKIKNKL